MERIEKQNANRSKGNYISLKEDQETKTLLFTGKYQKVNVPAKDFENKEPVTLPPTRSTVKTDSEQDEMNRLQEEHYHDMQEQMKHYEASRAL